MECKESGNMKFGFDGSIKLEFHSAKVTFDKAFHRYYHIIPCLFVQSTGVQSIQQ